MTDPTTFHLDDGPFRWARAVTAAVLFREEKAGEAERLQAVVVEGVRRAMGRR